MAKKRTTKRTRLPAREYDERRFREIGARFVRATDPEEQSRLKTELALHLLRRLRGGADEAEA